MLSEGFVWLTEMTAHGRGGGGGDAAYRYSDLDFRGSGFTGGVRAHHSKNDRGRHSAIVNVVVRGKGNNSARGVDGKPEE